MLVTLFSKILLEKYDVSTIYYLIAVELLSVDAPLLSILIGIIIDKIHVLLECL